MMRGGAIPPLLPACSTSAEDPLARFTSGEVRILVVPNFASVAYRDAFAATVIHVTRTQTTNGQIQPLQDVAIRRLRLDSRSVFRER